MDQASQLRRGKPARTSVREEGPRWPARAPVHDRPLRGEHPETGDSPPARPPVLSRELLGDERELLIEHRGGVYRLRLTSRGKLILTK
jgi:hemin uptake protein HemP